ncbi:MAG TPA: SpoIIE family protein phosphatase, partial [Acidobacteriota bacterium]|nr:SpoIIE family protein phosphatase [Acidobacteriota bacterium]
PDTGPSIREEKGSYGFQRVANLPLGIIPDTEYIQFEVHLDPGDLVVAATDAFIEARGPEGDELGELGLLALLGELQVGEPVAFGPALLAAVERFRAAAPPQDDQTLLVARRTYDPPPKGGFAMIGRLLNRLLRRA